MAFAETAELAVKLKLDAAAYERGMKGATAATASFGKTAGAIGGHIKAGVGSAITNLTKLGLVAGTALATQVKFGIDSLRELEQVTAQTVAGLASTRGASGQTAQSIRDMAESFEDLNATIDDKVIQSAENLLLTFPKIAKDAFKPALQAALDLNTALGGGEAGLQGVMIQVGKALQDPIRGLTALRRVGVSFTPEQEAQIKRLVKQNKLYDAQKIILKELGTEFGGRFAAAGKTADGTFAALGDSIEDLQMGLTEGLLPAITDVAKEITATFKDPSTKSAVKELGRGLGDAFKTAVSWAKQIPWGTIGSALKTAAGAAGTLIKAFADAPDWLKTAVITGWGLNKLTGGALTGIGGEIAKGIGGQFLSRGASPANPLFVKDVGGLGGLGSAASAAGGGVAATVGAVLGVLGLTVGAFGALYAAAGIIGSNKPGTATFTEAPITAARGRAIAAGGMFSGAGPMGGGGTFASERSWERPGDGGGSHSEDRRIQMASIDAIRANTAAVKASAQSIEKTWLSSIDPDKIAARSKAKTGRDATPAQVAAIRTRDELHQLKVITEKSQASSEVKLERLRVLAADAKAHGDTKTAAKVDAAIKAMKAKIATEQQQTTTAVTTGTQTLDQAIAASRSDIIVNVTTTVTASDVATTTVTKSRMGPGPGSSNAWHPPGAGP